MSKIIDTMKQTIASAGKKPVIVYAEGDNAYIQEAAKAVSNEIEPILIFKTKASIPANLPFKTIAIDSIDINPYANLLYELRKAKGMTQEQAVATAKKSNYLASLIVKLGQADGEICGIDYTTADTLRPALQILRTAPGAKLVSSVFMLEKNNDVAIFSDCAININPKPDELASMTEMACEFAKNVLKIERPKAALLSYSTCGSGKGEDVDKVRAAYELTKLNPATKQYDIFGEMQFDAAYDDRVRAKKAKACTWTSKPDIFMFPNINAGNIGCKIAQRMGGYDAFGPVLVGLAAPVNDLSRGSTVQDIIGVSYITAAQAVVNKKK